MLVILGYFDLHPDDTEAGRRLAAAATEETVKEPGCLHYGFSIDVIRPDRLVLTECWQDANALIGHLRTPHAREFLSVFPRLRIEQRVVRQHETSSSEDFDMRRYIDPA